MWKDEHEAEDELNDFSVEKMVDLMKRNGDWDDQEDERGLEGQDESEEMASMQEEQERNQ